MYDEKAVSQRPGSNSHQKTIAARGLMRSKTKNKHMVTFLFRRKRSGFLKHRVVETRLAT